MAEPKDGSSFLRKVARFVTNPATDWKDIGARHDESVEIERSELKAMIERKRRNDFVRKRELDTLRRLRREGLSPEQLAALGGSSKVEDSDVRPSDNAMYARSDGGVKAKIDEIEQQMVGHSPSSRAAPARRPDSAANQDSPTDFYSSEVDPAPAARPRPAAAPSRPPRPSPPSPDRLPALPPLPDSDFTPSGAASLMDSGLPPLGDTGFSRRGSVAAPKPPPPPLPPAPQARPTERPKLEPDFGPNTSFAVEVNEVIHDPELDEAVIAFANADFGHCEQSLMALCKPQGSRHQHAETWHVLFDLYRATGQQAKFESLSLDYANLFGRSSPQWYSMPKRVADAAAEERPDTRGIQGDVGWISPPVLDTDAVARLRSTTLQLPLPWVLDWTALQRVEIEAAAQLQALFRQWAPQPLDMRWLAAERLHAALQEAAPTGVRDADPAFWMARLEALRLTNRPDQFDEAAIDYCVTYEVSPPSWERAMCQVRSSSSAQSTSTPPMSIVSDGASSFPDLGTHDDAHAAHQVIHVDLSGQLSGDIGSTLQQIDRKLGQATLVSVSCARLIRVDFIAAGGLLNWVLARQTENRSITFADTHRLVALFFGAMGINEHARVQVTRD